GEIVNALMSHPQVGDVLVLPVARSTGPEVGALVEADVGVGVDAAELRAVAARLLPPWLQPQVLVVVERFPRLAGGKPDRRACGELLQDAGGTPVPAPSARRASRPSTPCRPSWPAWRAPIGALPARDRTRPSPKAATGSTPSTCSRRSSRVRTRSASSSIP